jgi:hypothetical protein
MSVRRQSKASVATERITSFLLLAEVGAEVGFESPDRDHDRAGHAELRFDLLEHRRERLHVAQALGHAVARDHAAGEFLEGLLEHALALVGGEHRRVDREAVECAEALARHALGGGFLAELGDEGVEARGRIAGRSERGSGDHRREHGGGEKSGQTHVRLAR